MFEGSGLSIKNRNLGFNISSLKRLLSRIEFDLKNKLLMLNKEFSLIVYLLCQNQYFVVFSLKKKITINIFFNFLISNYKSNRHLLGLPLNGQRTWSNKKTCKRTNNILVIFLKNKNIHIDF